MPSAAQCFVRHPAKAGAPVSSALKSLGPGVRRGDEGGVNAHHHLSWVIGSTPQEDQQADVLFAWLNGNGSSAGGYNPRLGVPIKPGLLYSPTSLGYGGIGGILDYDVLDALDQQFYLTQRNGQSDWSRTYTVEEKVTVGYVKFNIDTQLGDVPLRGNVGVRFVHTDQSRRRFRPMATRWSAGSPVASNTTTCCPA